jgi:hypothetical protein
MALNVGLNASFGNIQNWKGIWDKAREVNNAEAYVINYVILR